MESYLKSVDENFGILEPTDVIRNHFSCQLVYELSLLQMFVFFPVRLQDLLINKA